MKVLDFDGNLSPVTTTPPPQAQTPLLDFSNPSTHPTSIAYRRWRTCLFVSSLDVAVEWVEDKWLYFM